MPKGLGASSGKRLGLAPVEGGPAGRAKPSRSAASALPRAPTGDGAVAGGELAAAASGEEGGGVGGLRAVELHGQPEGVSSFIAGRSCDCLGT